MKSRLLDLAYYGEVFFSRIQGISSGNPRFNGEYLVIKTLKDHIKIAIDVGANVGDWSNKLLEETKGHAQLFALEPDPDNAKILGSRFKGNNKIQIREVAISDKQGSCSFSKGEGSGSGVGFLAHHGPASFEVKTVTLDSIWEELGRPDIDLIKMDIEGEEISALLGAEKLFNSKKIGTIQIEYNSTWIRNGKRLKEVFEIAEKYQYIILNPTPFGFVRYPAYGEGLEDYRMRNLLLVRADHLKLLKPIPAAGRARVEATRANRA